MNERGRVSGHGAFAATEITLTDAEMKALEAPYVPHQVLGHMVAPDLRSYARS